jgi:hypothetical protein
MPSFHGIELHKKPGAKLFFLTPEFPHDFSGIPGDHLTLLKEILRLIR